MDKITINGANFFCNLGVTNEEFKERQEISVDIELHFNTKKAAKTDKIQDTVNYSKVHKSVKEIVEGSKNHLIEALVESIAQGILKNFNVGKVLVRIKKPKALADRNVKYVSAEITRTKK